jgi:hypothetical protein
MIVKLTMRQVILDWEKTILEKVFFFILSSFFLNWGFVSKHLKKALLGGEIFFLETGHIGYRNSRIIR